MLLWGQGGLGRRLEEGRTWTELSHGPRSGKRGRGRDGGAWAREGLGDRREREREAESMAEDCDLDLVSHFERFKFQVSWESLPLWGFCGSIPMAIGLSGPGFVEAAYQSFRIPSYWKNIFWYLALYLNRW